MDLFRCLSPFFLIYLKEFRIQFQRLQLYVENATNTY